MSSVAPELAPAVPDVSRRWWAYSGSGAGGVSLAGAAESAAVLAVGAVLAVYVTPGRGGLDRGRMAYALASVVPALMLTRPWRHVPARHLLACLVLAATSIAVPFLTAAGWADAVRPAAWVYAAAIYVVARAFARDDGRRAALAAGIVLIAFDQFSRSWLPWWGGRDPSIPMIGTFYWHNPFAAYVLPGALVGAGIVVLSAARSRAALVGWVAVPFCAAGVVLSTSRATMLLLVAGGVTIVGLGALRVGRAAVVRGVALTVLTSSLLLLVTSSLVFPESPGSPLGGAARRSADGEGVSRNSAFRIDFWRAAAGVWQDHPVTGSGFDTFATASAHHLTPGAVRSPAAHNGVLQELADGGAVHGGPVLAVFAAVLFSLSAVLVRAGRRTAAASPVVVGGAVAAGAVLAHGFVDFDWMFPSTLAMTAVLCALGLAGRQPQPQPDVVPEEEPEARLRKVPSLAVAGLGVMVLLSAAAVLEAERVDSAVQRAAQVSRRDRPRAAQLAAGIDSRFTNPQPWVAVLDFSVVLGRPLAVPDGTVRTAIDRVAGLAEIEPQVAVQRALAFYVVGERAQARRELVALVDAEYRYRPTITVPLARLLDADGDPAAAVDTLLRTIRFHVRARNAAVAGPVWGLVRELDRLPGTLDRYRCTYASVARAFGPPGPRLEVRPAGPVPPSSSCEDISRR